MQGRSTWKSILPGEKIQWLRFYDFTISFVTGIAVYFILCNKINENHHQYCIVGEGPSGELVFDGPCLCFKFLGLQMGYFLQKVERDYIIIEKASVLQVLITLCQ